MDFRWVFFTWTAITICDNIKNLWQIESIQSDVKKMKAYAKSRFFKMYRHWERFVAPAIIIAALSFISPLFAESPVYDIQCGCYADPINTTRFMNRLQDLDFPWYSIASTSCTRFIADVNVDRPGISYFINDHTEFMDAFLVPNYWDLPAPAFEEISPFPSKETFTTIMAPYMQKQYKYGYYNPKRLSMEDGNARIYTQTIYEAASYYELDPFLLFALGNFESYFSNILGDLNRLKLRNPDPAQGMFQILRSTARIIYRDMKNQRLPHTPKKLPVDLTAYPKAQIYFAAHYLHSLHKEYHGNRYMALLFYNARANPNYDYPRKVMTFYQRALGYYINAEKAQPNEKTTIVVEAADYNRVQNQDIQIVSQ